jgi:hypothetical protein
MSLEAIKNNSCEFAKNFFLSPHKCSNNMILKVTAIVSSVFVFLMTLGIIHITVGVGYLIYKNYYSLGSASKNENKILEMIFGNKDWIKVFGPDFIRKEDINKDVESLPKDLEKILFSECQIDPEKKKKVWETHVCVWIPKKVVIDGKKVDFTIKTIGQLMKKHFFSETEEGYSYIYSDIMNKYGNKSIDKSGWVLLSKGLIPNSIKKSCNEQKELMNNLTERTKIAYKVSQTLPLIVSIFAEYIKNQAGLVNNHLKSTYIKCQESVGVCQVIVGGFNLAGLIVSNEHYNENSGVIVQHMF